MHDECNDPRSHTLEKCNACCRPYGSHFSSYSCYCCHTGRIKQGKDQKYIGSKRCEQSRQQCCFSAKKNRQCRYHALFCHKSCDQGCRYSPVSKSKRCKQRRHKTADLCQKTLICAGNKVKTSIKVLQEPYDQCRRKNIVNAFWIKPFAFSQISCPTLFAEGSL